MVRFCTIAAVLSVSWSAQALRFLGRIDPNTKELSWPASGLAFNFTGKSASVGIASIWGENSIEMVIDGGEPIVTGNVVGTSIDTPSDLADGVHIVEIRKRSEAMFGSIYLGDVTTTGTFGSDTPRAKRIQIIGDSVTAGYGIMGTYPCENYAELENVEITYGALTAKNLSADHDIIAWSGDGLLRNYPTGEVDSNPVVPQLWTRYSANDADNTYTFPDTDVIDIVVINLGTNDFAYMLTNSSGQLYDARTAIDPAVYTAGLVDFATTIRSHYPDVEIFITSSPLLSDGYPKTTDTQHTTQSDAIQAAVAQIGIKAHFVNFPTQDTSNNNIVCDYHPSASTHEQLAAILTTAIQSALGL